MYLSNLHVCFFASKLPPVLLAEIYGAVFSPAEYALIGVSLSVPCSVFFIGWAMKFLPHGLFSHQAFPLWLSAISEPNKTRRVHYFLKAFSDL